MTLTMTLAAALLLPACSRDEAPKPAASAPASTQTPANKDAAPPAAPGTAIIAPLPQSRSEESVRRK